MDVVRSKNDVPIRLTEERWFHITEEHSEMAGYYFEVLETVEEPEAIYEGTTGECIAVKEIEKGKSLSLHFVSGSTPLRGAQSYVAEGKVQR